MVHINIEMRFYYISICFRRCFRGSTLTHSFRGAFARLSRVEVLLSRGSPHMNPNTESLHGGFWFCSYGIAGVRSSTISIYVYTMYIYIYTQLYSSIALCWSYTNHHKLQYIHWLYYTSCIAGVKAWSLGRSCCLQELLMWADFAKHLESLKLQ